ncbi:MAG: hypothetical protein PHY94_07150 [Candidatus Omnitrophica bacterium]|nr:hypothetical protein [Candidatus Omnitrophota bacterium]
MTEHAYHQPVHHHEAAHHHDASHHESAHKEIQEGKFFAVISYIAFLSVVTLLLKKHNHFAVYHAKQGLVLFVFEVGCFVLSIIPFLGWIIKTIGIAVFILISLWGILQSAMGNYARLPFVSKISDKISL